MKTITYLDRVKVICKCGCGTEFLARPTYKGATENRVRVPEYKRGHHPNCKSSKFPQGFVPWNKGLTKETTESVSRQGRSGPNHWNYNAEQNVDFFANDFDYASFSLKFGAKPRSKGGNKTYAKFRKAIMHRDNYTCLDCGMVIDELEETDLLHVHHVVSVKADRTRIFDPSNVVTLCLICHHKRHRKPKKVAAT